MADTKHETVVSFSIFVLISIAYICSHEVVEGNNVLEEHKGTIKTIVSEEDVIDCVEFYKQPAFDDPLIKNNTKMMPESYPSGMRLNSTQPKLTQPWHKHGECPEGTIPIRRTLRGHYHKAFQFHSHALKPDAPQPTPGHEYAIISTANGKYYGAHALINVWNPKTEVEDFSLAQIWVISNEGPPQEFSSVEVGWNVYPSIYGDSLTRFFIYWTSDNYKETGCYNLLCAGFVQTSSIFALGSPLEPVSNYDGESYSIPLSIFQDRGNGNWWLEAYGMNIGYWPSTLFTGLSRSATMLNWGGEIYSTGGRRHTTTHMGSGHFPSEGYKKSSFFHNVQAIDVAGTPRAPVLIEEVVTRPQCYNLLAHHDESQGLHFFFGGPGFSNACPFAN